MLDAAIFSTDWPRSASLWQECHIAGNFTAAIALTGCRKVRPLIKKTNTVSYNPLNRREQVSMIGSQAPRKAVRYARRVGLWGGVSRVAARLSLFLFPIARRTMSAKHAPDRVFAMWLRIAAVTLALAANAQFAGDYARIPAGESTAAAIVDGAFCETGGGDDAPIHHNRHHVQCCVLCNAVGHDFIPHTTKAIFDLTNDLKPATNSFVAYAVLNSSGPRALGWASSWSSRAPPVFF